MTPRRGMSLVEVVVGLTVVALAAAIGASTLSWTVDRRASVPSATADIVRAAAVRRTLISWLEGAWVDEVEGPAFRLTDHEHRGLADDELEFQTSARTPLGPDVIVRLHVDRDPATAQRGLTAELTDWAHARTMLVELDSSIVALEIAARTQLLGDDQWVRGWLSSVVLPKAVELRLSGTAPERVAPLLRLPTTVLLGGGR